MKKLGVLLPSRNRPEGLQRAVESWAKNSTHSDIFFCFQEDDPHLKANITIAGNKPYHIVGDIGLAAKANMLCDSHPGYSGYMVLNDDQIIHTSGWDRMILDRLDKLEAESGHRLWIPHWRDGIHDEKLCQGFSTREMLAATGSHLPRGYMRHLFTDNYFMFIGKTCGLLHYMPEIFIEHLHFVVGKAPVDQNYQRSNSVDAYQRDETAFKRWLKERGALTLSCIQSQISQGEAMAQS